MRLTTWICCILSLGFALRMTAATQKSLVLVNGTNIVVPLDYEPKINYDQSGPVRVQYLAQAKKLVIIGHRFGDAIIHVMDQNNVRDIFNVKVVPANWQLYSKILLSAPNLRFEPSDGKILISGAIANVEDVELIKRIMKMDEKYNQVIDNTTLDDEYIITEAQKFLKERKFETVRLKLINKVVFVSGEVYDQKRYKQLVDMVTEYFKTLGCTINSAGLDITTRKIAMRIIFLDIDKNKLRQSGIRVNSPINWTFALKDISNYFSIGDSNKGLNVTGISGTINILQENNIAKIVYENQLSTLSGEKAQFQQGGVLNVKIFSQYNTDLKEIEYGFQVTATPYTIDANTIGLDFEMSQVRPKNENSWTKSDTDKDLSKYMTKSKYTMAAGSEMVISSIAINGISDRNTGLPGLSEIPWLGSWLFGSTSEGANDHELLLILHVDWEDSIQKENEQRLKRSNDNIEKIRKESKASAVSFRARDK